MYDDDRFDITPVVALAAAVIIGMLLAFVAWCPVANERPQEINQPTTCNCNCGNQNK